MPRGFSATGISIGALNNPSPVPNKQRHRVGVSVGDGDVGLAVTVEVADRQIERSAAHVNHRRGAEAFGLAAGLSGRVQQNGDRAGLVPPRTRSG